MWKCEKCSKIWYYPVEECVFCRNFVKKIKPTRLFVDSTTEIFVPSVTHKETPYFVILLKDEHNNHYIRKTKTKYEIGDEIKPEEETVHKFKVGIIGTGVMGIDIAELLLQHKMSVVMKSRSENRIKRTIEKIKKKLHKNAEPEEINKMLENLEITISYNALKDCDIVIECVIEDLKVKQEIFKKLDEICPKNTILASNTSSLSIKDFASGLKNPHRIIGLHFFNPVSKMSLVEVVKTNDTLPKNLKIAEGFVRTINKEPIVVMDSPAFIVNRIMVPYLNEAVWLLSQGIGKKEDIDRAVKLGLNHPLGPYQLLDLIGIDVFLDIMKNLQKQTGNKKFETPNIIERMIKENKLGRKSGEGFYKYR